MLRLIPFIGIFILSLPLLEIFASLYLADQIGTGYFLLWLLLSAVLGILLLKSWRLTSAWALLGGLRQGQISIGRLFWVARSLLAGLMLIFPGPLSDTLALLLLLPWPSRSITLNPAAPPPQADDVIEGEYHEVPPDRRHLP